MRQSGSALRKLIRSVAAAGLWSGGVGKDQERYASRKSQSGTGRKAAWDGLLIGPGIRLVLLALVVMPVAVLVLILDRNRHSN